MGRTAGCNLTFGRGGGWRDRRLRRASITGSSCLTRPIVWRQKGRILLGCYWYLIAGNQHTQHTDRREHGEEGKND
jgi:hypothetical protein